LQNELGELPEPAHLVGDTFEVVLLKVQNTQSAELAYTRRQLPQVVVGEDEDLEGAEVRDVLGDLAQQVRTQVQLYHVHPSTDINWKGREKVFLHVEFLQIFGSGKYTVRDPITGVVLHVEGGDVDELRRTPRGEGGELVPGQRDGVEVVEGGEETLGEGGDAVVLHVELLQQDRVGQGAGNRVRF